MLSIPSVLLLFISLMAARTSSLRISGSRSSLTSFVNSSVISMGLFCSDIDLPHILSIVLLLPWGLVAALHPYRVPQFPYLMSFCLSSFSLFHTLCRIFPFSAFPLALTLFSPPLLSCFSVVLFNLLLIFFIPVLPFLFLAVSPFFFFPYPVSFPLSPKACGEVVLS